MISRRARVGWSTHGHTAVDVNVYSSGGAWAMPVQGNVENTDIGKFLREYLEVDVDKITKELLDHMDRYEVQGAVDALGEEAGDHWAEYVDAGAFEDLKI
ncbi:alkaline phosphatase [Candidatus Bathyarchaeota archaeon]|nr:alkaline phosphatase [Candidatus Bathyarchaeota archaeon]